MPTALCKPLLLGVKPIIHIILAIATRFSVLPVKPKIHHMVFQGELYFLIDKVNGVPLTSPCLDNAQTISWHWSSDKAAL